MAGWLAADAGKGTEGWKETFFAFFFFPILNNSGKSEQKVSDLPVSAPVTAKHTPGAR